MHAPKTKDLNTAKSPDELFNVVLSVVQNGKFNLFALSNETKQILFTSGKTALSWGQQYRATVRPESSGASLQLFCGSHDDAPKALMDGWKNGKAADKVIKTVNEALASGQQPAAQPVASFVANEDGSTRPWDGR